MSLYEYKNGFGKKIYWPFTLIVVIITLCLLFGGLSIYGTIKSNQLRATNDRLTEQVNRATDTCARLTETIGECQSICRQLDESSRRDIQDIRAAIEIIEETRDAVGAMEVALGLFDSDGYYDWCDRYVFDNEVEE